MKSAFATAAGSISKILFSKELLSTFMGAGMGIIPFAQIGPGGMIAGGIVGGICGLIAGADSAEAQREEERLFGKDRPTPSP